MKDIKIKELERIAVEVNRIILIGNGFDLAHGLPTKYEDFINWYWDDCFSNLKLCYSNTYFNELCTLTINNESDTWHTYIYTMISPYNPPKGRSFIEFMKREKNTFTVHCSPFMNRIYQSIERKGWVDIENEYYEILKTFVTKETKPLLYKEPTKLNKELTYLKTKLIEYLTKVQNNYLTQDNNINPEIEKRITEQIYTNDISVTDFEKYGSRIEALKVNSFKPNQILVINFNYTKTADIKDAPFTINHIHGKLINPESIIFGYGDELDENFKEILKLNDNTYLQEIKSIRYLETDSYRNILQFIERSPFQIYIMGHSCGNSDRTLLNTLFEHKNCISIKPFYYQRNNGTDNYSELIQNIYRNFTNKALFRSRVVDKSHCVPLPNKN